jgi:iron complex outermembrane receptor protein
LTQNSSNPNLKPSTSTNYTFGVTYSPKAIKGYTFSVDYFHFDQKDFVSYVDQIMMLESVDALGAASPWAKYVAIGNFGSAGTPITGPGQIGSNAIDNVYVSDPSFNLARIKLSGFNLDMRYIFDTNGYGKFDVQARALIWSKYAVQFMADQTYYETAGKVTLTNGTLSRWNGNLSADWSKGNWGAASSLQFFPSVTDDNDGSRIPNIAQLDLSASYTFSSQNRWLSGLKVSLGANNVFNKFAPLDPATFTDANADIATYGAIGRLMYVKAQYKF